MAERAAGGVEILPRLPTRDPFSGGPLMVTELTNPATGTTFAGRFSLGWMGELTAEQLDFVGLLLARRNNLQRLAADLGIAYNTTRGRLEEIARALSAGDDGDDGTPAGASARHVRSVLERLASGELSPEEAGGMLDE